MMQMQATAALSFLPFVTPLALWVAWRDMSTMKIPNLAVFAFLTVFLLVGPFALPGADYAGRLLHVPAVLTLGFALTMARIVGAGDAKCAAAMAPFFAAADVGLIVPLFAAVLLAAFATHRAVRCLAPVRRALPGWLSWQRSDFPLGLALAGTLIFYLGLAALCGTSETPRFRHDPTAD